MEPEIGQKSIHPAAVILITLAAVFFCFQLLGPMIGFFIALPFYDGTMLQMVSDLENPLDKPQMKIPYFIMQGCGTLFGLILVPAYILKRLGTSTRSLFQGPAYVQAILLVVVIVISFLAVNSVFIEWNEKISLPSGMEEWAQSTEKKLAELTKYLTTFDSFGQVIIAFVVVAILPAIGEELVFRGIIQRQFFKGTGNMHVSIWVAAAIFSAIHLQFYGFVPRMLLGALFGYLYHWSGNLMMPMLAHFVNNGMMVIAMYLYQQKIVDIDMESPEAAPWPAVLFSALITAGLMFIFWKLYQKKAGKNISDNTSAVHPTIIP